MRGDAKTLRPSGHLLVFGLVLLAGPALGVEEAWTVESGRTVGTGTTVFWGQVGYPGIWAELIHGLDPTTELGGKLAFNYGPEGLVDSCCSAELGFQFLLRKSLFDNGKIVIAGVFDPGFLLFFPSGYAQFGLTFPVGVEFGFPVNARVSLNASFDLPMYVTFSADNHGGQFALPILFGGGVEYLMERSLALTFKLKLGPTIFTGGGSAQFTLYALFGAAYKF